jgi:hypothetical protein
MDHEENCRAGRQNSPRCHGLVIICLVFTGIYSLGLSAKDKKDKQNQNPAPKLAPQKTVQALSPIAIDGRLGEDSWKGEAAECHALVDDALSGNVGSLAKAPSSHPSARGERQNSFLFERSTLLSDKRPPSN